MKKGHQRVTFNPYQQDQLSLLPASLEELIPKDHLVRKVKEVIEEMGVEGLIAKYKGGGEPYLSADDDESAGKWIYPVGVYQPEAGESLKGRCELHVAEQAESPGLSQDQPVSRRGAEGQAVAGQVALANHQGHRIWH